MSKLSDLCHEYEKKFTLMDEKIDKLEEKLAQEVKKVKHHADKELKNAIAKRDSSKQKLWIFASLLAVTLFTVGILTEDGITFNREKVTSVLESVAGVVISSSVGGVCVYLFTKEK